MADKNIKDINKLLMKFKKGEIEVEKEYKVEDIFKSERIRSIYELLKEEPLRYEIEVNFNIFEWFAFKEMMIIFIRSLLNNSCSTGQYKSKNGKQTFYRFLIEDIKDMSRLIDYKDEKVNKIIRQLTYTNILIDIRKFDKIIIEVYQANSKNEKLNEILNENIPLFLDAIVKNVTEIVNNVKNAEYVDSFLRRKDGIENCEIEGYYNSKYIEIDAGQKTEKSAFNRKIIKLCFKFKNIYVQDIITNEKKQISMGIIYESLIKNVFQLFFPGNFCSAKDLKYYSFDSCNEKLKDGNFYKDIPGEVCEYKYDFSEKRLPSFSVEKFKFPQKTFDEALDKLFLLKNDALNMFYNSMLSYIEGLKSSVSFFHYYIALENIVKYEKNKKKNEIDVNALVKKYTKANLDIVFDWCYKMRNKYTHNYMTGKGIFNVIFEESSPMISYIVNGHERYVKIEELIRLAVSHTMIAWLLEQ